MNETRIRTQRQGTVLATLDAALGTGRMSAHQMGWGQTSSVNPGNLPFLLAPGEHITMLARFADFPSAVNLSNATYLHSHCVVTGWN